MKTKWILLLTSLISIPSIGEVIRLERNKASTSQAFIPISVDFDQETVTIQILEQKDYNIQILGNGGIVADHAHSKGDSPVMRIDMEDENRGQYEIQIQDQEGNVLKGKFEKRQ